MTPTTHMTEQQAIDALQHGRPQIATAYFTHRVEQHPDSVSAWLGLAVSFQLQGRLTDCLQATDQAIALEPGNLSALILKGDVLLQDKQQRHALQCYAMVLRLVADAGALPRDLALAVERVEKAHRTLSDRMHQHIALSLAAAGHTSGKRHQRFDQALALLMGEKQRYTQQPRAFYYPELPTVQFYDPAQFAWAQAVEQAAPAITQEFLTLLEHREGFEPYIQSAEQGPTARINDNLDSMDWSAFFLIKDGQRHEQNIARCPQTMAALQDVPFPMIGQRSPMVLFSMLQPGARIAPHHGFLNTRLICHLPLVIPPDCGLRVGNETRTWQAGKLQVFNDAIEHEAWNRSDSLRAVLIFDIWRPELCAEERRLISHLLESVDSYDRVAQAY